LKIVVLNFIVAPGCFVGHVVGVYLEGCPICPEMESDTVSELCSRRVRSVRFRYKFVINGLSGVVLSVRDVRFFEKTSFCDGTKAFEHGLYNNIVIGSGSTCITR